MLHKKPVVIVSVFLVLSFALFVFWQQGREFIETEPKEFSQLYVAEIPSKSVYLAAGASAKFYEALQPGAGIIVQNPENILPGLLQIFDVQYVLLRDEKYWELFEPFLNYFSAKEKEDLPRTFPVKKEALTSSSNPFLILGEGWYPLWKNDYGVAERFIGEEATILYVIPPGTLDQAPEFLSFLAPWSPLPDKGKKAEIEVIVNGKLIYSSDSYCWTILKLSNLQEGINEIKLRSPRGCVIPEGDERCLSFNIQQVELFDLQEIPREGLVWLDQVIEIEEGQYWTGKHAAMRVFAPSAVPSLITFQMQSVNSEARMIRVIEKDREIDRIILFGQEPQKISLLTYQREKNVFYLAADDCQEKTIKGEKRCITARIKDLAIELLE